MYYVIGTSVYKNPQTTYIYHNKLVYPYGIFPECLGYPSRHKAQIALRKIDKAVNHAPGTRAIDLVTLTVEIHVPEELK